MRATIIVLMLGGAGVAWSAAADAWLDAPIEKADDARPGYELLDLCRALNKPCGQEKDREKGTPKKISDLGLKKSTPRKALDEVGRRYPKHKWAVKDGVLIVEPKTRTGEDYLSRKLDRVSIHDAISLKAGFDVLRQAKIPGVGLAMTGNPRYGCVDIELSNVSVRDALNAIAKADGQVMWQFSPGAARTGKTSFHLFSWRKTGVGLYHKKVGFINVEDPAYKGSCRELENLFAEDSK